MKSKKSLDTLIRKDVLESKGYQLKSKPYRVKLNQNECPYIPENIFKHFSTEFKKEVEINRYPQEANIALRKGLAKELNWPADGISLANGSNVFIQGLVMATAINGTVLTVTPTFSVFKLEAKLLSNQIIEVPLRQDFTFCVDEFLNKMREVKPNIIFFSYPNAPTGNLFPKEDLLKVVEAADCIVVMDEAYYEYSKSTFFNCLKEFNHLVIMRTFSKSGGLAGVRLGYLLGAPEIIFELEKVLPPFRVSTLAEKIGLLALDNRPWEEKHVQETRSELKRVFQALKVIKGIHPFPSEANFLLFRVDHIKGASYLFDGLAEQKILVRDYSQDPGTEACIRLSIGTREENDLVLKKIKEILGG